MNRLLNYIKDTFSKKEFNPKLIDLKLVKLLDNSESDKSKMNPSVKGLLLDETKGNPEEINLDSDSNYKLETLKNIKPLEKIRNYPNNYSSWIDYLYEIIFTSGNQQNLNYFSNFLPQGGNLAPPQRQNNRFCFNCDGSFMAYINQKRELIISNLDSNELSHNYKAQASSSEGVTAFNWDTIYPNKIFYSTNNELYECLIIEDGCKLIINKYYVLSKWNKFINCFPSPRGDLTILLYEKYIEVYDIFQNLLFSKYFTTFKFKSGLYDYKSTVFITYMENKLFIFNLDTFDFKTYSYFPGNIIKVITNPDSDNIYIFVNDNTKPSKDLFMYTLTDISVACDVNLNYNSYQNYDNFYRHCHYSIRPEVYAFQHNFMGCKTKILDVALSPNEFRVGILYEEQFSNSITQNSLYIFAVVKKQRDNNTISKIIPLYNFGHAKGSQIVAFKFNSDIKNKNINLVVRFEEDKFIKTEKING